MKFNLEENSMKTEFDFGTLQISGNEEHGFRPFQLMVASIVSCSGLVFRNILKKQRIEIEDMSITADVTRNEKKANKIEKIALTYTLKGSHLNENKLNKSLAIAKRNCAMARSVESSIEIEEHLKLIESK